MANSMLRRVRSLVVGSVGVKHSHSNPRRRMAWVGLVTLLALLFNLGQGIIPVAGAPAVQAVQHPTVNGLFYGDGDYDRYVLYNTSEYGSKLYMAMDTTVLYVALVLSRTVNDNVFEVTRTNYSQPAGWNPTHDFGKLEQSDHAAFTLICGGRTYSWHQDLAYLSDGVYVSNPQGPDGGGTPPPGMISASSTTWNVNNYRATWGTTANPAAPWNMYVDGTASDRWHSPYYPTKTTSVVGLEGYPAGLAPITWSEYYQWEWPLVYEFQIDLLQSCAGSTVELRADRGHNSPSKNGDENDDFPPDGGVLKEFGDLPDSYRTTLASNGPRHEIVIGGIFLGDIIDTEHDGIPSVNTLGDDTSPVGNDEDGVELVNPTAWFEGAGGGKVDVTFNGPAAPNTGWLCLWFDWGYDGQFDPAIDTAINQQVFWSGQETQRFTIDIPAGGLSSPGAYLYYRARLFAAQPAEPLAAAGDVAVAGTTPSGAFFGPAVNGEVEDYHYATPTTVNLLPLTAIGANGSVLLTWETTSEIDNLGFNLYRATSTEGERIKVNAELIHSLVAPGSPFGAAYEYVDTNVKNGKTYYYWLEDLDIYGKTQLHGPVEVSVGGWLTGKGALPPIKR